MIHRLLEFALVEADGGSTFDDMVAVWNNLLRDTESKIKESPLNRRFSPLVRSVPNLAVLQVKAINKALEVARSQQPYQRGDRAARGIGGEVTVRSRDGRIVGRIDRAIPSDRGLILQDYKIGSVTSEDNGLWKIKPEYREQLQLYAALYFEHLRAWPTKLELVPLSGKSVDVEFTHEQCLALLAAAIERIEHIDQILEAGRGNPEHAEELLAQPSPKACKYCPYRPACPSYLTSAHEASDAWPVDVWGHWKSQRRLGNGTTMLEIEPENGEPVYVREVNPIVMEDITRSSVADSQIIGVFDARRTRSPLALDAGRFTAIWTLLSAQGPPEKHV